MPKPNKRRPNIQWTLEQEQNIYSSYILGKSVTTLSKKYNVSRGSIYYLIKQLIKQKRVFNTLAGIDNLTIKQHNKINKIKL